MHSLRQSSLKGTGVVIFVTILFCLLMCPHDSFGAEQGCRVCEVGFECLDLCDCQNAGQHHECALDSIHSHEFRDDTSSTGYFNFDLTLWNFVVLWPAEPQQLFCYSDAMTCLSSPSFAVRHLDTIILRI